MSDESHDEPSAGDRDVSPTGDRAEPPGDDQVPPSRVQWTLVAGLSLLSASAAAYEISPASVTPLVMPSLDIGAVAAGWIVSVMYGTAVLASIPVGLALDRWDARRLVGAAAVALLVAGAWSWVAATGGGYLSLLVSRVLGGLSYVVFWNAGIHLIGSSFGTANRATAVGVFTASAPAGFAIGQFGGPQVAAILGWPAIFPVFAGIGAVGLAVFWPASRGLVVDASGRPPTPGDLRSLFTDRGVVVVSTLAFLGYSLYLFLNSWMPSYLTEELGLTLAASGLLVALFPAVGLLARTTSGLVSDGLFESRRRPVARLSFVVAVPAMAGFAAFDSVAPVFGLLVVAGLSIQLSLGLVFTYVQELVDPALRGTAVSFGTAIGLSGAFVAPVAAGSIIDATGSYRPAFLVATVVAAVGLGLAVVAPEANPGDS